MDQASQLEPEGEDDWTISLFDILCILLCCLAIFVNPPSKASDANPPGSLSVEIRWPDACAADVDLWVQAPGDRPVGYSNLNGRVFNLLRDDLGTEADLGKLNYENAYTRGLPAGDYAANVFLYADHGCAPPVAVDMKITARAGRGSSISSITIASKRVTLSQVGEELTVARFTLDAHGALVPGSLHDIPIKLREAR